VYNKYNIEERYTIFASSVDNPMVIRRPFNLVRKYRETTSKLFNPCPVARNTNFVSRVVRKIG